MDITSLYAVIPNGEGLLTFKHFVDLRTVKESSSEALLRLAELVLQCAYWNRGHPDNESQSDGRTKTIDSNIFKSSQSKV